MSMEGFRDVFARSSSEVRELQRKHQKAARDYCWVVTVLTIGTIVCLFLILSEPGNVFAGTLIMRIFCIATVGLLLALGCAIGALLYHNSRAEHFTRMLDTEYITYQPWEIPHYYN